jgi:hypothetical protein
MVNIFIPTEGQLSYRSAQSFRFRLKALVFFLYLAFTSRSRQAFSKDSVCCSKKPPPQENWLR